MQLTSLARSGLILAVVAAIFPFLAGCDAKEREARPSASSKPKDITPMDIAVPIVAHNAAAARGDREAAEAHFRKAHGNLVRSMKIPDPARPVDRELARAAA